MKQEMMILQHTYVRKSLHGQLFCSTRNFLTKICCLIPSFISSIFCAWISGLLVMVYSYNSCHCSIMVTAVLEYIESVKGT